jgi:xylan 1,4-beta-xylosidase
MTKVRAFTPRRTTLQRTGSSFEGWSDRGSPQWHPRVVRSALVELSLEKSLATLARGEAAPAHGWSNPIIPGDHPDPTIVEVDGVFWASATSGEWSPQFPLFRSTDLVRWEPTGSIFPEQPAWAEGSFWAPELVHDEVTGRFVAWYVAKQRGGPLCIAVASAESPVGPYADHGPVVCQEVGAIDPCFARDEHGAPYLIWKEDGNSRGLPTPIWAQPLTEDLLHLTGEKTMLIINDTPWEGGVVEGPYVLRHEGRFYLFYAGNACCGRDCNYAEGIARADRLLGPWEKDPGNPIIGANANWRCPGHGTAVKTSPRQGKAGQEYFLYHAYPEGGTIYVGREAILDEITWPAPEVDGRPGWPSINAGRGPGEAGPAELIDFVERFETPELGASWQWPVNTHPTIRTGNGGLTLGIPLESPLAAGPVESAMVAVPRPAGLGYRACVSLEVPEAAEPALWAGLSVVGDPFNTIGLGVRGDVGGGGHRLVLWQRRGDTQAVVWQTAMPRVEEIHLGTANVGPEHFLQFSFSLDGLEWKDAGPLYDATDLPAWDRGLRIGLMLEGRVGLAATFREFTLIAK